jgi:GT2 family glycosyltransferase
VIELGALERLLDRARQSPASTVIWGCQALCDHPSTFIDIDDVDRFVRTARWYRGLTPPSWAPGGKGEFNFEGRGTGNGQWHFILGGFWLIRTAAIRTIDWPDRRLKKLAEDVLFSEALRQQGWTIQHTERSGCRELIKRPGAEKSAG